MKELSLENYSVIEMTNKELLEKEGGTTILGFRGWAAAAYAIVDGVHDVYQGWVSAHNEANTTW